MAVTATARKRPGSGLIFLSDRAFNTLGIRGRTAMRSAGVPLLDEPQGGRLRQSPDGEFLPKPQDGAGPSSGLRNTAGRHAHVFACIEGFSFERIVTRGYISPIQMESKLLYPVHYSQQDRQRLPHALDRLFEFTIRPAARSSVTFAGRLCD